MAVDTFAYWAKICEETPPVCAFWLRKYDSAKATVLIDTFLPGIGKLEANQAAQPMHLMISTRALVIGFQDATIVLKAPSPPVPCTSTAASAVVACMDESAQLAPEQRCAERILGSARIRGTLDGADGAYSNRSYFNWTRLRALDDILAERKSDARKGGGRYLQSCGNHSNRVIENDMKSAVDEVKWIDKLGMFVSMLKASSYFLRLLSSVWITVSESIKPVVGELPHTSDVAKQFEAHLVHFHMDFADAGADKTVNRSRTRDTMIAGWDALLLGSRWQDRKQSGYVKSPQTLDKSRIC